MQTHPCTRYFKKEHYKNISHFWSIPALGRVQMIMAISRDESVEVVQNTDSSQGWPVNLKTQLRRNEKKLNKKYLPRPTHIPHIPNPTCDVGWHDATVIKSCLTRCRSPHAWELLQLHNILLFWHKGHIWPWVLYFFCWRPLLTSICLVDTCWYNSTKACGTEIVVLRVWWCHFIFGVLHVVTDVPMIIWQFTSRMPCFVENGNSKATTSLLEFPWFLANLQVPKETWRN